MQWRKEPGLRILDFDIECRPLHWINAEYVSKEITAIGAKWIGEGMKFPRVWLLGECTTEQMLTEFLDYYNQADMVAGHYIRGYDLPTLASALLEFDLPPLGDKLAHDTKKDLIKFEGLSKSQENLASTLGIPEPKIDMNQAKWRSANRLEQKGLELSYKRVYGDVVQNIAMREELLRRRALGPPVVWRSGPGNKPGYIV